MPGPLVVERETLSLMADLAHSLGHADPLDRRDRFRPFGRPLPIDRERRVLPEEVFEIRDHQLLVLLLVVETDGDGKLQIAEVTALQYPNHVIIDVLAICEDFLDAGPRDHSTSRTRKLVADRVVVRVEQHPEIRGKVAIAIDGGFQHQRLEKPGRVRQMPLDGTGVRHRLDGAILCRQRLGYRR